jgi:hypothetical protein
MDTKFIEIGPIGRIQLSAAVILRVGIVVRYSFATEIIVGAQHSTRYFLWASLIAAVVIRYARILAQKACEEALAANTDAAVKHKSNAFRLIFISPRTMRGHRVFMFALNRSCNHPPAHLRWLV